MSWIILQRIWITEILLLLCVIISDVATRLISNKVCVAIAILGVASHLIDPLSLLQSMVIAVILFLSLLLLFLPGWIGGGDVKLLGALAVGLSITPIGCTFR